MFKHSILLTIAISAMLVMVPGEVGAQQISSPYRFVEYKQDLGALAGYVFGDRGKVGLGIQDGPVFGTQWAIRVSDPLQLGAFVNYIDSKRDVIDPAGADGPETIGTISQDLVLIGGRIHLNLTGARTWHRLIPYVFGGIGMAVDVSGEATCLPGSADIRCLVAPEHRYNFKNAFMIQVGLGFAWLPAERLGFRFTVADDLWQVTTPEGWFLSGLGLGLPEKDWTHNLQLSAALHYWF